VLSANAMPQDRARRLKSGFDDSLSKPQAIHRFPPALALALDQW